MKKKLYMKVTTDEYELPLIVADNLAEMARLTGLKYFSIASAISRWKKGIVKKSSFIEVEVENEEQ